MILCKGLDNAVIPVTLTKTISLLPCAKTIFSLYECIVPGGLCGFSLEKAPSYITKIVIGADFSHQINSMS